MEAAPWAGLSRPATTRLGHVKADTVASVVRSGKPWMGNPLGPSWWGLWEEPLG